MVAAVACVSATDMDEQQHSRTFSVMLPCCPPFRLTATTSQVPVSVLLLRIPDFSSEHDMCIDSCLNTACDSNLLYLRFQCM